MVGVCFETGDDEMTIDARGYPSHMPQIPVIWAKHETLYFEAIYEALMHLCADILRAPVNQKRRH